MKRLALALALVACIGCSSTPAPWESSTLRVHYQKMPLSTSLLGKFDRSGEILATLVTDSLVQFDGELTLHPRVAESWEFSDDQRTITFRLRDGIRWHDGEPVTADDVVFSVERVRDPATENTTYLALFADLESVEAIDARTVRATFQRAHPDMLEAWRLPLIPRHAIGDEDLLTGSYADRPVGCGPWRVLSIEPDVAITLEANPDYWDGKPEIERLVMRVYQDQRTAYQSMLRGELDLMVLTPDVWSQVRDSEESRELASFSYDRFAAWMIVWSQDEPSDFFADARVRRAMVAALDRESFAREVAVGLAAPGTNTYSVLPAWRDPSVDAIPYDVDEAARLLDQAGWVDSDGDGIRDRDGRPFRFEFLYPAGTQRLSDLMMEWKQEQWAKLGIEAELVRLEWNAFRERRNAGAFDAVAFAIGMTQSGDQRELYHSEATEAFNFYGLADDEVDRLLDAGSATFDVEERRAIYNDLQRRLSELEPLTVAFVFKTPVLHDPRLVGLVAAPVGLLRTIEGPQRWSWDPTQG